jgi:hypothetical protein
MIIGVGIHPALAATQPTKLPAFSRTHDCPSSEHLAQMAA